jgi:homoserine O-acetyltransferase
VAAVSVTRAHTAAPPQPPHAAEHHEFLIEDFRTESGVALPKARIVYGTYGRLNAARDNAVLLPSHYMANHHGYDWLIGAGPRARSRKAVPDRYRALRQRPSSSPSNTPEPFTDRAFR